MAKRKTESGSDNDKVRSSKKSNNSVNQSYIQTANLMSKTKLFQKGLNSSTDAIMAKIKVENTSESESEDSSQKTKTAQSKTKSKHKASISNSDSDNERESTIKSLLNETKDIVLKKKSKKSQKRKNRDKLSNNFSPKILPNIKNEPVEEDSIDYHEVQNVNSDQELVNGYSNSTQEHDDEKIMTSVEKKIHVIQDIRLSPAKTKTPQQQLNELYPNLTMVDVETKMKVKESVDVYLLRVPKSVNPQNISDLEINLEDTCKIKVGGERFIIRPTSKIPDSTLVLGNKTEILNFKRNLVMEKYIKANKRPNIPAVEKSLVLPPNNLKIRHPLFGSNFEQKIQLDEEIEKRLDEAIKNLLKPSKSKKNKKEKQSRMAVGHSTLLAGVSTADHINLNISSISPQKKSKKKKSLESNTEANDDCTYIADLFKTNETKKHKKNKECNDNGEDSRSFDKDLSSEIKTKKRKIKEEPMDNSPKKKKKK